MENLEILGIIVALFIGAVTATWALRGKNSDIKEALLTEITAIKSDLAVHRREETRLREDFKELKEDFKEVRYEVKEVRIELKEDSKEIREDLKELKEDNKKLQESIQLLAVSVAKIEQQIVSQRG